MTNPPACDAHRTLVDRALGPDPDDATLERYAAEVASCEECRRLLSIRVGAHPARLDTPLPALRGMRELASALETPAPRARLAPIAAAVAVAAGLALAAAAVFAVLPDHAPIPAPAPAPAVAAIRPPLPPTPPTLLLAPVSRQRIAPLPAPRPAPLEDDAVAELDDWPAPPFEELRGATAKGPSGSLRAVELVLSGPRQVGSAVGLTVVSSTDTPLAVCVSGPERGVVWRGGVPAGRTELTRGGAAQRFAFSAPGRYRFLVSTDAERCVQPVHVVEVEVAP